MPADVSTPPPQGAVARLIAWSARNPVLTVILALASALWGLWGVQTVALDAIPDVSDTQVLVETGWPGRSPDLVEDAVTYPLTAELLGASGVTEVRGQSHFGTSLVTVLFDEDTDPDDARSRVLETLTRADLPAGASPRLGPDATALGWVFQYALVDRTGAHSLADLRRLQDTVLRFALLGVEGVAEVAPIGGFVEEWQVQLDPDRLLAHGVSVLQVAEAVRAANVDAGGRSIEIAGHEQVIRGRGQLSSLQDLEDTPVGVNAAGTPLLLGDLAWVSRGPAPRRGIAELDGQGEVVGAVVIARQGTNALTVIDGVKDRLAAVEASLPDGVEVVTTYDRATLITRALDTLRRTLLEEMLVVGIVMAIFLLHFRSVLVPAVALPLAVLLSFGPLSALGMTANLMSLGGIAVAIGAMVDASIVLVENAHRQLAVWEAAGRPGRRRAVLIDALQQVGPGIFFSLLVLTVSFLPVFGLQAAEGRLFRPLATTKTFSMAFAALLAVTLVPALVVLLMRGRVRARHPLQERVEAAYARVVRAVVRRRRLVVAGAIVVVAASIPPLLQLESEFMPPLDEGDLLFMPTAPPGMGATEAGRVLQSMDAAIAAIPEVERVFGKIGRAETATDPAPLSMAETTVLLKPRSAWRPGLSRADLIAELDAAVQVPGMPNLWWMPIQTRTEMLTTGVRSPIGITLRGDTTAQLEAAAVAVEAAVQSIPGTQSAFAERATGGFYLDIDVRRAEAARHGLSVAEIYAVVEAAIGGLPVTTTTQGRQPIDVTVRYARDLREHPEALGRVLVPTAGGGQVPLSQVAELRFSTGPPMLRSEDGRLVTTVFVDPDEVAIPDWVAQARERIAPLDLGGVELSWSGQIEAIERAEARFALLIPLTLGLVALLLWMGTRSWVETALVLVAVPFSLVGAVWLVWLLGFKLSAAVAVGFLALAGLDAETAVVMLLYLRLSRERRIAEGRLRTTGDLEEAIVEGAAGRLRPKLMTVTTTLCGLLPLLWSAGVGADLMQRIAAPMVGGLVTSFLLELTVYPALFAIWRGRGLPAGAATA